MLSSVGVVDKWCPGRAGTGSWFPLRRASDCDARSTYPLAATEPQVRAAAYSDVDAAAPGWVVPEDVAPH